MSEPAKTRKSQFVIYDIPRQPAFLAAVGEVVLLHSQLDRVLRLTIKSVANTRLADELVRTQFHGSARLRRRIDEEAKRRLGDGIALRRLRALLRRCYRATGVRNELVHAVWFREIGSRTIKRTYTRAIKRRPSVPELRSLAKKLDQLAEELSAARLKGFLAEALAKNK